MSRPHRVGTAFAAGLRETTRTPVLLALLAFLPAYFVGVLVVVLPSSTLPVDLPGGGTATISTAALYGVLLVPLVAALVGALAGLFLMEAGEGGDARLVLAGYRPGELFLARVGLLVPAGLVAAAVSLAVLALEVVPERPAWVVVAALLAGLTYGLLGVLAGLALSRLAGVYLLLFLPMVDVLFFQNPMVGEYHRLAPYLPGHAVTRLAVDAGFSASVALDPLGSALAYLLAVGAVAAVAFHRAVSGG